MGNKKMQGLTITRDQDSSQWFTQLIQKAELIEYSPVSGCYILRPRSYHIWEKVQNYFDNLIKSDGVRNSYFPLFIPENLLSKEASHVEGFAPEVAWVETGGSSKLKERLAVRPTSETIMYDSYSKWIRSYKDLPLRLNQWCNVVRWEFKHCTPFLRSREFLWQEGHTVFATRKGAVDEAHKILDFYKQTFEDLYAVPVMMGQKSDQEKFAGADFTLSVETFLPNGKAIQGATSHHLGQNFSKAFDISFTNKDGKKDYGHQNSWGISTRSIGVMIMIHSDDKGLVLPPKVAETQVVIVPILFDKTKAKVMKVVETIAKKIGKKNSVHIDDRADYSPGWKFNEWEMKGVPLRIEIGPRDLENKTLLITRRDNGEKQSLPIVGIEKEVELLLEQMQQDLLKKAQKNIKKNTIKVENLVNAKKAIKDNKMIFAPWCTSAKCEESFKDKTGGAKSLNAPFKQPNLKRKKCFACNKDAVKMFYFAKSY